MSSTADRMKTYKNKGKDVEELRRRRNDASVELRKQKKDDQLLKRRNVEEESEGEVSPQEGPSPAVAMSEILAGVASEDPHRQLHATQSARKMLSKERHPPIDTMIGSGIVPRLVTFLAAWDSPALQFEAAWALTNIASGTSEQTRAVVGAGAIPAFIQLVSSQHRNVSEQAVWALGNIAGDGPSARDLVIKHGGVQPLLDLVRPDIESSFLRNVAWTLSNMCRNKDPPPPLDTIRQCLPALALLIRHQDTEVAADACWALSYLTDGANDKIEQVVSANVVSRLVHLLASKEMGILTPSLRAIGNIVTGSDAQTQAVIDAGALPHFAVLLNHSKINIQKEAAWAVSNITAGNSNQIEAVINAGILPPLVDVLARGEFKSQKEAAWAVTNLTSGGTVEQIVKLVSCGALPPMCDLLRAKEAKTLVVVLDGISNILQAAEKLGETDSVCEMVEEAGGLDKIEALQNHENEQVYQGALQLIETFFSTQEEEETTQNNGFNFNIKDGETNNGTDGGFSF